MGGYFQGKSSQFTNPFSGVAVQTNHTVERGAKLLTLEAMKMQSNIYAPISGRVTKLLVAPGQHVEAKDLLVMIVP